MRWNLNWLEATHLNDGGTSNRADALRANVESSFENANVSGDHETACHSWIDVAAADMSESLRKRNIECVSIINWPPN